MIRCLVVVIPHFLRHDTLHPLEQNPVQLSGHEVKAQKAVLRVIQGYVTARVERIRKARVNRGLAYRHRKTAAPEVGVEARPAVVRRIGNCRHATDNEV